MNINEETLKKRFEGVPEHKQVGQFDGSIIIEFLNDKYVPTEYFLQVNFDGDRKYKREFSEKDLKKYRVKSSDLYEEYKNYVKHNYLNKGVHEYEIRPKITFTRILNSLTFEKNNWEFVKKRIGSTQTPTFSPLLKKADASEKVIEKINLNITSIPNKLKQKAQEYVKFRNENCDKGYSNDWSEEYKWKTLQKTHKKLLDSNFSKQNILKKAKIIQKSNPSVGSFCSWRLTANLVQLAEEKPALLVQVFKVLFDKSGGLSERINEAHELIRKYDKDLSQGTPSFAFILAIYNYEKYPIYKDSTFQNFKKKYGKNFDVNYSSIGEKYQKFVDLCRKFGKYIDEKLDLKKIEADDQIVPADNIVLNGQDFLYYLEAYDTPKKKNNNKKTKEIITKQDLLEDLFISEKDLDEILELLNGSDKQQIILQGPPGTGKTYIAREVAKYLTQTEANINTIQFHPSYSYEDFMEGYRPTSDGDFSLEDGVFKKLCDEARSRPDEKFVMIIDEINRGNLSKVFGELMYLLEYRGEEVQLTYSKDSFSIPENVYLIGTMNTADRSLAIMDYALRRRFYFVDQPPRLGQLEQWLDSNAKLNAEQVVGDIQKMNDKIENFMGSKDYNVGHSYFMKEGLDKGKLEQILNYEVRPLLQEYFFDNPGKVDGIVGIFE